MKKSDDIIRRYRNTLRALANHMRPPHAV